MSNPTTSPTSYGSCLCGAVRYTLSASPKNSVLCHCIHCKKATGSAFAANDWYDREDLHIEAHPPSAIKKHVAVTNDVTGEVRRHFCGECGSPLYVDAQKFPQHIAVSRGTNDGKHSRDHALNAGEGWEGEVTAEKGGAETGDHVWKPKLELYCNRRMTWLPEIDGVKKSQERPQEMPEGIK